MIAVAGYHKYLKRLFTSQAVEPLARYSL